MNSWNWFFPSPWMWSIVGTRATCSRPRKILLQGVFTLGTLGICISSASIEASDNPVPRRSIAAPIRTSAGTKTSTSRTSRTSQPVAYQKADSSQRGASTANPSKSGTTKIMPRPLTDEQQQQNAMQLDSITIRRSQQPRRIRDYSWIYIDQPLPREIKVHDIITIVVDENSEVTQNARYTRQRMGQLKAELKEFMRIDDEGNLAIAAADSPSIDGTLQSRLQSAGDTINREGIKYRIAATVVDVMPNGHLVLEARKSIRANYDVWEYTLTGILRPDDVNRDNTALTENVANLDIVKRQRGRVFDATKRPWGIYLWDQLMPF
ncbi:MAG: flagellar basal body L-ring protein FlgH [Planctomycetaceae bacterium]